MKLLLDTHVLLWAIYEPDKLSPRAVAAVKDARNSLVVSAATAWEIATKYRLGKLPACGHLALSYRQTTDQLGVEHLAITSQHAIQAGTFEVAHRDPFDRMLAAQSLLERCPLVTCDPALQLFGVPLFW